MIKFKPYLWLLIVTLILFVSGFMANKETIDINVHDTYYVILRKHLYWLLSGVLFVFSIFYFLWYAKINFGTLFSELHVLGTFRFYCGIVSSLFVNF